MENDNHPGYLYHVYKMMRHNDKGCIYVAEGPATRSMASHEFIPPINTTFNRLAKAVLSEHLAYLKSQEYGNILKSEDLYMTFSFDPTCHKVMRSGEMYSAKSLNEKEQDKFCKDFTKIYKSLDDLFENTASTRP